MKITAQKKNVFLGGNSNPSGLHAELSALFGTGLNGISHNPRGDMFVNLFEDATTEQIDSARAIIDAHNPIIMAAGRVGDVVTAVAWMPYSGIDSATFTIDGQPLATATTFGPHIQSGYTGLEVFVQADQIRIGVSGHPAKEVTI